MNGTIARRPVEPTDGEFLRRLYASTREQELVILDWSDEQKDAFVAMQYDAQDRHYRSAYPDATFEVIIVDGRAIGRIYIDRGEKTISLIDISLLPAYRGRGIGTRLLRDLQREAAERNRQLRLHVDVGNRAGRLYQRLGFEAVGEAGVYQEMEWRPVRGAA